MITRTAVEACIRSLKQSLDILTIEEGDPHRNQKPTDLVDYRGRSMDLEALQEAVNQSGIPCITDAGEMRPPAGIEYVCGRVKGTRAIDWSDD